MKQILLHASSQSIAEDIEFYLTDRWDKHNQVRPAGDIRSMTPDSTVLALRPDDKQVGNFLYPIARHLKNRGRWVDPTPPNRTGADVKN